MKKVLLIHYDFSNGSETSYGEILDTLRKINKEDTHRVIICTNCLSFFNFDYLKKFDDIVVYKKDKSFISLKDLLEFKGVGYTTKEIRESHNVYKMLLSNSLCFKKVLSFDENGLPLTRNKNILNVHTTINKEEVK